MIELAPRLWQFNELGPRVNIYLWRGADGLTLVDAGYPGDGRKMLAALDDTGFSRADVVRIVITHGDLDHIGGLAELGHALRVPIHCHPLEAATLKSPLSRTFRHGRLRHVIDPLIHGLMQTPRYAFPGMAPNTLVEDGELIGDGLRVVHTPGHTPGHISLFQEDSGVLFAGDALLCRHGRIWGPAGPFTPDMKGAMLSIQKLARRYGNRIRILASGHSQPLLQDAGRYIRRFIQETYL